MLTRVHTVTTIGLDPVKVDVEVTTTTGIPQIFIIGLVTTSVREAKDRIITALKSIGFKLKARKTIISLIPADLRKSGNSFDLAIAVALLSLYSKLYIDLKSTAFIGEVSIDGSILPVSDCLGKVLAAKNLGYQQIIIPIDNLVDCVCVDGITILGIRHLKQVIVKESALSKLSKSLPPTEPSLNVTVVGQSEAVRTITIAIAGKHHLHMVGPPGVGKSTLPQFAQALQPKLCKSEALEVTGLYSVVNITNKNIFQAPFRNPHHTATVKKIIGYDSQLLPGEISLAHQGILFLDELPLFSASVLQALRNPLDNRTINLQNHQRRAQFPCDCIVVAASNPCPCGFWQTGVRQCSCSKAARNSYKKKLSWPLLERFDLQTALSPLSPEEYSVAAPKYNSASIADVVLQARNIQKMRFQNANTFNSHLKLETISRCCSIKSDARNFLKKAVTAYTLSTRGYEKVIAVAQTIADLESSPHICTSHLAEALQYRPVSL